MSKISDMVVSMLLKKGVLGDFKNFETQVNIPQESDKNIIITIKAENLQVRLTEE